MISCAITYDYARIRRLVRLVSGLVLFRVAANSAIGSSSLDTLDAWRPPFVIDSRYGGCVWEDLRVYRVLESWSASPRTAATLIRLAANRGSSITLGALPCSNPRPTPHAIPAPCSPSRLASTTKRCWRTPANHWPRRVS
ncbi:hypothetical protein EMIT0P43_20468 [Pseudomonas jessenii]